MKNTKISQARRAIEGSDERMSPLEMLFSGKAGFALKSEDMVNLFKAEDAPRRLTTALLLEGIRRGGRKANAFDTALPFIPYSRISIFDCQKILLRQ